MVERHGAGTGRSRVEADHPPTDELLALGQEHRHPVGFTGGLFTKNVQHLAQRTRFVQHSHRMAQPECLLEAGFLAVRARLPDRFLALRIRVQGRGTPRLVPFALRLAQTVLAVRKSLLQLGDPALQLVLDVVDLHLRGAPGVLDVCLCLGRGVGQRAPEVADLLFQGASDLIGMPLSGFSNLQDLRMRFLPDLGSGVLGRQSRDACALLGRRPEHVLRERAKIGFEMPPSARERAFQRLADLVVERHVSNYSTSFPPNHRFAASSPAQPASAWQPAGPRTGA